MKEELCKAFCAELTFRSVPAGLAVGTVFRSMYGDPIGFYIVGPDPSGIYRIEDDGATVPLIESTGADLDGRTRREAFNAILEESGVTYDEDTCELTTPPMPEDRVPSTALKFIAMLLRLQDLILLTPERAASTFKEDAARQIRASIGDHATIKEKESVLPGVEFPADLVITAENRPPVAVYLAMTEQRVLEAVVAQMAAIYEKHVQVSVVALLEKDSSITNKMRRYASNRLTALPIFEGDEDAAIARIHREVLGSQQIYH